MGEDLRIFLVNQPTDIAEAWFAIREGLHEVQKKGHGEESDESILLQLMNAQLFLWIIVNADGYLGFFTTKKVFTLYQGDNVGTLIVNHYYKKTKQYQKDINKIVNEFIDNHAKETGCKFIKMYTARTADRYWKDLGYLPTYTEYVKELTED